MKALSWKEPYASLMLHGKVETRTWYTDYRGPVLICGSKQSYLPYQVALISGEIQSIRISNLRETAPIYLKNGFAFAVGNLVNCDRMMPEDEDRCFVAFNSKLFCHIYENVREIEPFPWKGSQRWKNVPEEIIKSIIYK